MTAEQPQDWLSELLTKYYRDTKENIANRRNNIRTERRTEQAILTHMNEVIGEDLDPYEWRALPNEAAIEAQKTRKRQRDEQRQRLSNKG